jgi:hypothetical protein
VETDPKRNRDIEKAALEHAWAWFSLHATQRLQSVNFFLITIAFLSAAFVTAAKEQMYLVAGGVAILATSISYFFYRLERRIQSLVKAAEAAIEPLQESPARELGLESLQMVSLVEHGGAGEWKYSKVFRYLYLETGTAFVLGLLYVCWAAFSHTPGAKAFDSALQAVVGIFFVLCGHEMILGFSATSIADNVQTSTRWSLLVLGVACIIVGIVITCHLVFFCL